MKAFKKAILAALVLLARVPAIGQPQSDTAEPVKQPSDLHFVLSTKDGRTQFYLGEVIEMEEAYSADIPDNYLLLSLPRKVKGGHSAEVTMRSTEDVIDRWQDQGDKSAYSILHVNCSGGVGSGIGGDCADCNHDYLLRAAPIRFPYVLTSQFQITEPGHYVVEARAASVIRAPLDPEKSVPIAMTSNSVEIDVVEDFQWSGEKLRSALARFEKARDLYAAKGWDDLPTYEMSATGRDLRIKLEFEMQQAAEALRVLDTEDSLADIVHLYDGIPQHGNYTYDILYHGIIQSKHQTLAAKLLEARILERDFAATRQLIDQLTAMTLENQFPGSLASKDAESLRRYYPAARKILHDYILALANSLPEKDERTFGPSLATVKAYAPDTFCTNEPLIPNASFNRLIRQVQAFDPGVEQ